MKSTSSSTVNRVVKLITLPRNTGRPCGLAFEFEIHHALPEHGLIATARHSGPMELQLPAVKGIGGAPLYLIDRYGDGSSIYDIDFEWIGV